MTNLENQYLKELASKCCVYEEPETVDSYHEYHFNIEGLQALADEYAAKYLSERNECVEEIRKLREALKYIIHNSNYCLVDRRNGKQSFTHEIYGDEYLVTSPTIERLLKESK